MVRNGEDMDLKREVIRNLIVDGVIRLRGGGYIWDHVMVPAMLNRDMRDDHWESLRKRNRTPNPEDDRIKIAFVRRVGRLFKRVGLAAHGVHKLRSGKFYPDPKPKGKNLNKSKLKMVELRESTWRQNRDEGRMRVSRSMKLQELWYSLSYFLMDTACPVSTAATGYWNTGSSPGVSWTMLTLTNFVNYVQSAGQGKPLYSEVATSSSIYASANIYYGSTVTPEFGPFCSNSPTYPTAPTISFNGGCGPFNTTIYNFVADWPFTVMWWESSCNNVLDTWSYLRMRADNQYETTDPKFPVTYSTFAGNKDWQKMVVFGCQWDMKFTNYSGIDHTVEVLFYKMIPDPHVVNYSRACGLPYSQMQNMDQYCQGTIRSMGSKQIMVVKRDRFVIRGTSNWTINTASETVPTFVGIINSKNVVKKQYKIKRHYAMNRGIINPTLEGALQFLPSSTDYEYNFFQTYYKLEEGIFCRMQAWPSSSCSALEYNFGGNKTVGYDLLGTYNQMNVPVMLDAANPVTNTAFAAGKKPCVGVSMTKKAYFKFDKPLLKGPFIT